MQLSQLSRYATALYIDGCCCWRWWYVNAASHENAHFHNTSSPLLLLRRLRLYIFCRYHFYTFSFIVIIYTSAVTFIIILDNSDGRHYQADVFFYTRLSLCLSCSTQWPNSDKYLHILSSLHSSAVSIIVGTIWLNDDRHQTNANKDFILQNHSLLEDSINSTQLQSIYFNFLIRYYMLIKIETCYFTLLLNHNYFIILFKSGSSCQS